MKILGAFLKTNVFWALSKTHGNDDDIQSSAHVILKDLKNSLNDSEKRFFGCSESHISDGNDKTVHVILSKELLTSTDNITECEESCGNNDNAILNKQKSTQSKDCLILKLFRMTDALENDKAQFNVTNLTSYRPNVLTTLKNVTNLFMQILTE